MSASSPQPLPLQASLRQAGHLGRRHGRAAVYWQIGERSTGREFYRDLLRGIARADPAITGLYEVPYLDKWVPANKLSKNEHLKAPSGGAVTVVGGTVPKQHDGWMWDLTVPGNNDHDFYVIPDSDIATSAVLVHNCGPMDLNFNQIRQRILNHVLVNHGDTAVEGTKFGSNLTQDEGRGLFNGLVNRIGEDNATGIVDATGNHEHILAWPGAGANGENFVRVWMTSEGQLGSMWPILGP